MRHKPLLAVLALAAAVGVAPPSAGAATSVAVSKCVTVIPSSGDIGERFCVDDGDCVVAEYRTTLLGTERSCTVSKPGGGSGETAATATGFCYSTGPSELGSRICVSTTSTCVVSEYRWTGTEGSYTCLVPRP